MIYKNRVKFCTDGNWYAVAYMIDVSKPQFMNVPIVRDLPSKISLKHICMN